MVQEILFLLLLIKEESQVQVLINLNDILTNFLFGILHLMQLTLVRFQVSL